jgi:hypothetical protein
MRRSCREPAGAEVGAGAQVPLERGDVCKLEVLKWLREHHCPWDKLTCDAAAGAGHLLGGAAVVAGAPLPVEHYDVSDMSLHPAGSRALGPTVAHPGARLWQRTHSSPNPMGSHASAPTATHPGAPPERRMNTSTPPTGSDYPEATSTYGSSRSLRRTRTSKSPTRSREHAPTATHPCARTPRRAHRHIPRYPQCLPPMGTRSQAPTPTFRRPAIAT